MMMMFVVVAAAAAATDSTVYKDEGMPTIRADFPS
jgi:hypothetical protein